jgi:hypothetical protein
VLEASGGSRIALCDISHMELSPAKSQLRRHACFRPWLTGGGRSIKHAHDVDTNRDSLAQFERALPFRQSVSFAYENSWTLPFTSGIAALIDASGQHRSAQQGYFEAMVRLAVSGERLVPRDPRGRGITLIDWTNEARACSSSVVNLHQAFR